MDARSENGNKVKQKSLINIGVVCARARTSAAFNKCSDNTRQGQGEYIKEEIQFDYMDTEQFILREGK